MRFVRILGTIQRFTAAKPPLNQEEGKGDQLPACDGFTVHMNAAEPVPSWAPEPKGSRQNSVMSNCAGLVHRLGY